MIIRIEKARNGYIVEIKGTRSREGMYIPRRGERSQPFIYKDPDELKTKVVAALDTFFKTPVKKGRPKKGK